MTWGEVLLALHIPMAVIVCARVFVAMAEEDPEGFIKSRGGVWNFVVSLAVGATWPAWLLVIVILAIFD